MEVITYKLEDNHSFIEFEEGEELYFGDPCYVVPGWDHDSGNDVWDMLCNKMFHPVTKQHPDTGETYTSQEYDFDDKNHIRVVEIQTSLVGMAGKFHMWSTNFGDGSYPLTYRHHRVGTLGVDAGCLSIIPMSLIRGWGTEASAKQLGHITNEPASPRGNRSLISVADGDMNWGDYDLLTGSNSQDADAEWDEHWIECDENSYV